MGGRHSGWAHRHLANARGFLFFCHLLQHSGHPAPDRTRHSLYVCLGALCAQSSATVYLLPPPFPKRKRHFFLLYITAFSSSSLQLAHLVLQHISFFVCSFRNSIALQTKRRLFV